MNLTNSIGKMFSTSKLIKLILISGMIYQVIDVTIKYRKYPTIIKSDLKYFQSGDLPSITLCRNDDDWQFAEKYKNSDRNLNFVFNYTVTGQGTGQHWGVQVILKPKPIATAWENQFYYNSMTNIIESNIDSLKCFTLFSKLQLNSSNDQMPVEIIKPQIRLLVTDM